MLRRRHLAGDPRKRQGAGRRRKEGLAQRSRLRGVPRRRRRSSARRRSTRSRSGSTSSPRPPGRVAETALRLLAVADGVAAAYEAEKRELAALDFNDLLIRARDLLAGPHGDDLRKRLAAQTRLLLVDEFQDTDPLQVELVKALCDGRFTGGQAVLRGRQQAVDLSFPRRRSARLPPASRRRFPPAGRLPLSLNFRSQPAVLEFVNALFGEELKGPDEEYEPLRADRGQVGPTPAVEFLWAIEPEERRRCVSRRTTRVRRAGGSRAGSPERQRRREADLIARRLRGCSTRARSSCWEKDGGRTGPARGRAARRRRPAVPRLDRRGVLRGGPAALGHRLLPGRRPCLLRPAGNLRRGEPAAVAGQSRRRGEPGRRAAQPAVRPAGRDAFLAGAASGGLVGGTVCRGAAAPSWAQEQARQRATGRRDARRRLRA